MATDVTLVIPWRPSKGRRTAFRLTVAHWRRVLGVAPLLIDSGDEPFNLAASRNLGVSKADGIVVVADADTVADPHAVHEAISAVDDGLIHLPYTSYRSLRKDGTREHRQGRPLEHCTHVEVPGACSGVLICTTQTWWSIGGQDDRFRCWAPEDWAFRLAAETLIGDFVRHRGNAYQFHHEPPPGKATGPLYDEAVELYGRYVDAHRDPAAMRALVSR